MSIHLQTVGPSTFWTDLMGRSRPKWCKIFLKACRIKTTPPTGKWWSMKSELNWPWTFHWPHWHPGAWDPGLLRSDGKEMAASSLYPAHYQQSTSFEGIQMLSLPAIHPIKKADLGWHASREGIEKWGMGIWNEGTHSIFDPLEVKLALKNMHKNTGGPHTW